LRTIKRKRRKEGKRGKRRNCTLLLKTGRARRKKREKD
jgi:hypothetical protein